MADNPKFSQGDLVLHPRRPEWGEGVVDQVSTIYHDGRPAQRVVVTFANHGRVTINTAVAPLIAKTTMTTIRSNPTSAHALRGAGAGPASGRGGWLAALEQPGRTGREELWRLPEALTDPFLSLAKRIEATLDTYQYSADPRNPRALLDWAIMQTGLSDPLTKYTRHELEQAFPRFARDRDQHLHQLARAARHAGKLDILDQALQGAKTPAAREAMLRAIRN